MENLLAKKKEWCRGTKETVKNPSRMNDETEQLDTSHPFELSEKPAKLREIYPQHCKKSAAYREI